VGLIAVSPCASQKYYRVFGEIIGDVGPIPSIQSCNIVRRCAEPRVSEAEPRVSEMERKESHASALNAA